MTNQKKTSPRYSPEVRERAVRMVFDHAGCAAQTLHTWVRQAERDQGLKPGPTTDEREHMKQLEREVRELR